MKQIGVLLTIVVLVVISHLLFAHAAAGSSAYIYADTHTTGTWINVDIQFGNNGPDTLHNTSVQCLYPANLGKAYVFNAGIWAIANDLWWEEAVQTHRIGDNMSVEFALDSTTQTAVSSDAAKRNLNMGQAGFVNLQIHGQPGVSGTIQCKLFDSTDHLNVVANTNLISVGL